MAGGSPKAERGARLGKVLQIMFMSGVDDGTVVKYSADNGDGHMIGDHWSISVGRRDDNDLCLRNDTYVSRQHANLHWRESRWWLEDCESTNGTFIENQDNPFEDERVTGTIRIEPGQLFRIGRTWLRIQEAG